MNRKKLNAVFNNPNNRYFKRINDLFAALTLFSVAAIVLETVPELDRFDGLFWAIELTVVAFFTVEYLLRLYAAPSRRKYVFSFFGIVDLLAIIPTFVAIANLTFLKSARVLRILRLLRMLRLAKLARLRRTSADAEHQASIYKLNIQIYFTALLAAILAFGSLIYVFEAPHQGFQSIPAGMMWATEMIVGGSIIGNYPQTLGGQAMGLLARFTGLVLLGVLIFVVGQLLNRWLLGDKK